MTVAEQSLYLQKLWASISKYSVFKVIIGGDFNDVLDIEADVRKQKRIVSNKPFMDFGEETNLSDVWRAF